MSYVLKENNVFYGSKGAKISNQLYDKLPSQHQLLFEKYGCHNNDHDEIIARIKRAANNLNNDAPRPIQVNVHNVDDFRDVFYQEHPLVNLDNEIMDELEDNDDEVMELREPF